MHRGTKWMSNDTIRHPQQIIFCFVYLLCHSSVFNDKNITFRSIRREANDIHIILGMANNIHDSSYVCISVFINHASNRLGKKTILYSQKILHSGDIKHFNQKSISLQFNQVERVGNKYEYRGKLLIDINIKF